MAVAAKQRDRDESLQQAHQPGVTGVPLLTIATLGLFTIMVTDILVIAMPSLNGSRMLSLMKLGTYLAALAFAVRFYRVALRGVMLAPELTLLTVLAGASAAWSVDARETVERFVALGSGTVFCIYLGTALSLRRLVLYFGVLGVIVAGLSVLALGVFPAARGGIEWENTWRGAFLHKNKLGLATAVLLPFCAYCTLVTRGPMRLACLMGALASAALLAGCEARTAQLIALLSLAQLLAALLAHRALACWILYSVLLLAGAILAGYVLLRTGIADPLFEAIGRKPTLSGRIPLWALVMPHIGEKLLLGWGYTAFWDPEAPRVLAMASDPSLRFVPAYSHNGLLELWLSCGLVGVLLFFAVLVRFYTGALQILRARAYVLDIIPLVIFVQAFILSNVTEGSILGRDSVTYMVFVAVVVKVAAVAAVCPQKPPRALDAWSPNSAEPQTCRSGVARSYSGARTSSSGGAMP